MATAALGRVVRANNDRIRRADVVVDNPRPLSDVRWHHRLVAAYPDIRAEWDRFAESGGRLPRIDDVLTEDQGTVGVWRVGLLVANRRPCTALASAFPHTLEIIAGVSGLRSALWSVLEPGSELPEHCGPNAGVLRYHLGIRCGEDAALSVGAVVTPYRDGEGVWFDDTAPHAAWNRGDRDRVTLFLEVDRPLPPITALANRCVQRVLGLDHRYRTAPRRAAAWDAALNPRR
ncbi:MAG: aspartyl/asparaginyl beta-hydroxylase domain-containing protein [Actinomycetes bacterium]